MRFSALCVLIFRKTIDKNCKKFAYMDLVKRTKAKTNISIGKLFAHSTNELKKEEELKCKLPALTIMQTNSFTQLKTAVACA